MRPLDHRTVPGRDTAEFRTHWRALAGCTLAASVGTVGIHAYTGGAFVAALTEDGLYTRTQLSLATFLLSATVAVMAPVVGTAMDRYGALRIIMLSVVGEAAAFAILGAIPASFAAYLGAVMLLALVGVGTTPPGFARIVTARFDRSRGLALGIMISGLGVMAMSAPIWTTWVIGRFGWRSGYGVVACIVLLLGGAGTLLIRSDRHQPALRQRDGGTGVAGGDWSALRSPIFWMIFVGFLSAALFGGGYLLHMISLLRDRGFSATAAASTQSLIGLAVMIGRIGSGAALDRFRAQRVGSVAFAISAAGCLLLITRSPLLDGIAALAIGLTIGAELDIMAYMISRHFGLASFTRLYGLSYGGMILAGGLSPLLISLIDTAASYDAALLLSAAGLAGSAFLLLLIPSARSA